MILKTLSSFEFWILLYRPVEIHPRLWVLTEDEQTAVCGFPTSHEKQFLFNHLIEILQYAKLNFVVWVNLKTEIDSSGGHPYQKKAPESIGIQQYEKAMSAESPLHRPPAPRMCCMWLEGVKTHVTHIFKSTALGFFRISGNRDSVTWAQVEY